MKILIAEDRADDRRLLKYIIEKKGHQVLEAADGRQAMELLQQQRPDLIISDALMPVMDGFELLRRIKKDERLYEIPFIFYSSTYTGDKEVELALSLGADAFVIKPMEPDALWARVMEILESSKTKKPKRPGNLCSEDEKYLQEYSQVVADKLEKKVGELEKAQAIIVKSETRYRNFFNSVRDVIIVADKERCIIDANQPALRQIFGYELEDIVGQKSSLLYADEESFKDAGSKIFDKRGPVPGVLIETPFRCKDGSTFPGEMSAFKLVGMDDEVVGNAALIRDISDRQEAARKIVQAKDEWERTFNAITEMVTIQDLEFRIVNSNQAAAETFNLPAAELQGKLCYELFRGVLEPCSGCPIIAAVHEARNYTTEIEHLHLKKTFQVSVSPLFDEQGKVKGVIHFAKDITAQKKLEEQFRQSQKMESIGTLAGGIAHDFNNILTGIIGYTEMVENVIAPEHPGQGYLKQVLKSADRATQLILQIMTFSRQSELEKKPLHLQTLLKEALKLLRASLPTSIDIEEEIAENCGTVIADATQIHQIVMNLGTNARQAMAKTDKGLLRISLQPLVIKSEDRILFPELAAGTYLSLEISDTGTGIDKETIKKIFDPYFTTKEQGKGTGLGLAVVHGIVKGHGGTISVYSEPGQGTTFKVILPTQPETEPQVREDQKTELPRGRERVLVVDDEKVIAQIEKRLLGQLGYQVTAFSSSGDAFKAFQEQPEAFDLVLTDMTMPGMNGIELAQKILSIKPDMAIIIVTGFSPLITPQSARKMGLRGYLKKPFQKLELAETVRNVLDETGSS